jgi:hypothetical protein
MSKPLPRIVLLSAALALAGCAHRNQAPAVAAAPHKHEHHPPHGGTPVVLAEEVCHLELVLDPATGTLRAYVLDGELENFIRIAAPELELHVTLGGAARTLRLRAVADRATGEKVGDTSLFAASAPWLKGVAHFQGSFPRVEVRGQEFRKVSFAFPEGNDKD